MVDRVISRPDYNIGLWAEEGELIRPSSDKVLTGHVVEKPPFQMANWIENRQDQGIAYLLQNGLASWDSKTFYPEYAFTLRNGVLYQALVQNTKQPPENSPESWVKAFYSRNEGDLLAENVDKILNEDGFLSLYVRKSNPIMDAVSKGVGYAFKDSENTGIFYDNGQAIVRKDGQRTHSFERIKDVALEDNDKLVTMADLRDALDQKQAFPVGGVFISTVNTSPNTLLGYGTWEKYAQGKVLVGQSEVATDPNWARTLGSTYGEFDHQLTVEEMASHQHTSLNAWGGNQKPEGFTKTGNWDGFANDNVVDQIGLQTSSKVGGDKAHNNVQPSIVVHIWRRTG